LFLNGLGTASTIGPCNVYAVDIFFDRNAEVSAVANAIRAFFTTVISGTSLTLIKNHGVVQTSSAVAALCWFSGVFLILNIRYGRQLRAWKDMGYTLQKG